MSGTRLSQKPNPTIEEGSNGAASRDSPPACEGLIESHRVHPFPCVSLPPRPRPSYHETTTGHRFADGAAAIDGRVLRRMEAVGKNLFAFFGEPSPPAPGGGDGDDVVVHVHFGMSGAWAVFDSAESEPEVRATTRLR